MQASKIEPESNSDFDDYEEAIIKELKPDKREKIAKGVYEHTIGAYAEQDELLPEKVLMVVGATGKGKSTLINRMINHIFGVEYTDEFRYKLVIETTTSQTQSQTRNITKYTLLNLKDALVNFQKFKFVIIDTPGIGDTEGIAEDERTIEKIKNLFASNTITTVDAICFVANYNEARLDEHTKYIFQTTAQIFGKDIKDNIFIMATCCDKCYDKKNKIKPAPVSQTFKAAKIPFKECFPFNNTDVYKNPETKDDDILASERVAWKTSTTSFNRFFEQLDQTTGVSLVLSTKIVCKQKNILNAQLPKFDRRLKDSIHSIDEHKENLKGIESKIKHPTKDFTYVAKVSKKEWVLISEPGIFCMKCKKCNEVCHYPCTIQKDDKLWWCSVMSWFNRQLRIYCTVCPKECSWEEHTLYRIRPEYKTVEEVRTNEYLKENYLKEWTGNRDDMIKAIENVMVSAYGDMLKELKGIQQCIDFIREECLIKFSVTLETYIKILIKKEEEIKEDGYQKRTNFLENLITAMEEANKNKTNIFEAFSKASSEEQLQQAKLCYRETASTSKMMQLSL